MEPSPNPSKALSILQLILGIFSLGLSIMGALGFLVVSVGSGQLSTSAETSFRYLAWISLVIGMSALISGILAIRRLSGKKELQPTLVRLFLFASICLAGAIPLAFLTRLSVFATLPAGLIALENVLLIIIPAWWFIELGKFRLPGISKQKTWGVINFSGFISMPIIVLTETLLMAIGAVGLILWASQLPGFDALINQLKNAMYVNPDSIKLLVDQYQSFLQEPGVIGIGILFITLAVPLVEELLKPLAMWLFIKKQLSPAEGFIIGIFCGGMFAVVESLVLFASVDRTSWLTLAAARSGTSLLHITTAGLSGWALASSWLDGKYLRVGITYAAVVFLHGAWNMLAVITGLSSFTGENTPVFFSTLSSIAPWIMGVFAVAILGILFTFNLHLRRRQTSVIPPQLPPALPE